MVYRYIRQMDSKPRRGQHRLLHLQLRLHHYQLDLHWGQKGYCL